MKVDIITGHTLKMRVDCSQQNVDCNFPCKSPRNMWSYGHDITRANRYAAKTTNKVKNLEKFV